MKEEFNENVCFVGGRGGNMEPGSCDMRNYRGGHDSFL